jgi:predicted transcriptional regulator
MRISAAESQVLNALWRQGPLDAEEVTAAVAESQGWAEPTVRTLLGRLVQKKAVAKRKEGRRYVYRPLIERADYLAAESQGLLDRLFEGRLGPFVSQFAERRNLKPEDIARLQALIAEIDNDDR